MDAVRHSLSGSSGGLPFRPPRVIDVRPTWVRLPALAVVAAALMPGGVLTTAVAARAADTPVVTLDSDFGRISTSQFVDSATVAATAAEDRQFVAFKHSL